MIVVRSVKTPVVEEDGGERRLLGIRHTIWKGIMLVGRNIQEGRSLHPLGPTPPNGRPVAEEGMFHQLCGQNGAKKDLPAT